MTEKELDARIAKVKKELINQVFRLALMYGCLGFAAYYLGKLFGWSICVFLEWCRS